MDQIASPWEKVGTRPGPINIPKIKQPQPPRKRGGLFLVLAVLILLVLVLGFLFWIKNRQLQKETETMPTLITGEDQVEAVTETPIAETPTLPAEIPAGMASGNYKIAQLRFGGDVAVLTNDSENLPLMLSEVRSESFLTKDNEEIKLVIHWKTNKLAISDVEYAKSNGQNPKKFSEDDYSFNHSVVISGLEPATVYMYNIISRDRWGNEVKSDYFGAYTGSRPLSVFELIAKALNDIFGWAIRK